MDFPISSSVFITDEHDDDDAQVHSNGNNNNNNHVSSPSDGVVVSKEEVCIEGLVSLAAGSMTTTTTVDAKPVVGTWYPASSYHAIMHGFIPAPWQAPVVTMPSYFGFHPKTITTGRVPNAPHVIKEKKKRGRPKGRLNNKTLVRLEEEKKRKELQQQQQQEQQVPTDADGDVKPPVPPVSELSEPTKTQKPKRPYRRRAEKVNRTNQSSPTSPSMTSAIVTSPTTVSTTLSTVQQATHDKQPKRGRKRCRVEMSAGVTETAQQRKLRLNAEAARRCRHKKAQELSLLTKKMTGMQRDVQRLCSIVSSLGGSIPDDLDSVREPMTKKTRHCLDQDKQSNVAEPVV